MKIRNNDIGTHVNVHHICEYTGTIRSQEQASREASSGRNAKLRRLFAGGWHWRNSSFVTYPLGMRSGVGHKRIECNIIILHNWLPLFLYRWIFLHLEGKFSKYWRFHSIN